MMNEMCYADTAYILAILLPQQPFANHAKKIEEKLENQDKEASASEAVLLELLFKAYEKDNLEPVRLIRNTLEIVSFDNVGEEVALKAAYYMREYKTKPADSLHIAHSTEEAHRLITSDMEIKEVLKKISGSPNFINLRSPDPKV